MRTLIPLAIALFVAASPLRAGRSPQSTPAGRPPQLRECPVSKPDDRDISGEALMAAGIQRTELLYGSDVIATTLWPDGTVVFRPDGSGTRMPDGSLRMKFLWIKDKRPLSVTGRRLDGAAPPLRFEPTPGFEYERFQPSYLLFPKAGCWEVTAKLQQSTLTFVTRVRSDY
jgi:hypothetical protein